MEKFVMSSGLKFNRVFTTDSKPVVDQIEWKTVPVKLTDKDGKIIFEMPEVEVPEHWSETATIILAQKYFRKRGVPKEVMLYQDGDSSNIPLQLQRAAPAPGTEFGSETSAKQVFHRIAGCWAYHGWKNKVFNSELDARIFYDEIYYCLAMQYAAPNSPQFFNSGLHWAYGIEGPDSGQWVADQETEYQIKNSYERPQPHACFIQPVNDDLVNEGGIMDLWVKEARLFKHGSGSGTNFSTLRAENELLGGGGQSSGMMSFLRIGDRAAGAIKSAGTTRRAAKMVIVNADHPEIEEFIDWKLEEENKVAALVIGSKILKAAETGKASSDIQDLPPAVTDRLAEGFEFEEYNMAMEGEAYSTVSGQNSNNSVRVTKDFMKAVEDNNDWRLTARTDGSVIKTVKARDLWHRLSRAAWACGDPGLQFDTTINEWHTCINDGRINASNPCFTGDTKVWTINGPVSFKELANTGNNIEVLTELSDGTMAFRTMANPRQTQKDAEVLEIVFSSQGGSSTRKKHYTTVHCTKNHEFFLRKGGKVRADGMRVGDSIESVYRSKANQKGYVRLKSTNGDDVMEHYLYAEREYGRRPEYPFEHGHHLIGKDNFSGNIVIIDSGLHNSEHMKGKNNAVHRMSPKTKEQWRKKHSENNSGSGNPNYGNKLANKYWINNGNKNQRISDVTNVPDGWRRGKINKNHTVVSIRKLVGKEDVYCGTVPETGRFFISLGDEHKEGVLVSNCSEYLFLDSTACNLASLNLVKFRRNDGSFDVPVFEHAVRIWTVVLEISVMMASFPSKEIARNTYLYRTLGLGYANLGGLLMRSGIGYGTDEGRAYAAGVTALLTGVAYRTSAELAQALGPFARWEANKNSMRRVLWNHARAAFAVEGGYKDLSIKPYEALSHLSNTPENTNKLEIAMAIDRNWKCVINSNSFRNSQVSVIAPTGTIGLLMSCDSTGAEPEFSLVKHKTLSGGGHMVIVNQGIEEALHKLRYGSDIIEEIQKILKDNGGNIYDESIKWLTDDERKIFDCAAPPPGSDRCLSPEDHVYMMAALQPFISGGISKTVNMPNSATIEDVRNTYKLAEQLGVKSIALFRDGSKLSQPHNTAQKPAVAATAKVEKFPVKTVSPSGQASRNPAMHTGVPQVISRGVREEPPSRRFGYTQRVRIGDHSLYLTINNYEDGRPCEIFLQFSREGSTLSAMGDLFAMAVSLGLQHGVPVETFVNLLRHRRFEPSGIVEGHDRIKMVSSIADYVAREFGITFLGMDDLGQVVPVHSVPEDRIVAMDRSAEPVTMLDTRAIQSITTGYTGDTCPECGNATMVPSGSCLRCDTCGSTTGCG
jgi:ribonucleotide reductase alpha subunit